MLKMNLNKLTTQGVQNRQKLLVAVIALGTLSLILFLVWISSAPKPQDKATSPPKETHIETVSNTVDNRLVKNICGPFLGQEVPQACDIARFGAFLRS